MINSGPPPLPRTRHAGLASRDALSALARPIPPLDLRVLAALPSLPLRARYLVDSHLTGRHRSPHRGAAMEFAEYRAYQLGDEIRRIDWRLYGRSDRLSIKRFEEENQLRIGLVLDLSASLAYASRPDLLSKTDFARTLLAAVALLARRQQDAAGLALVGDTADASDHGIADYLPPRASPAHHQAILSRLGEPPVVTNARLPEALTRLADLLPRGSVLVIASDFYGDIAPLAAALRLLRSRHIEVLGLQVLDPMEIDFAGDDAGLFVDLENGLRLPIDAPSVRAGYLKRFAAFQRELADTFIAHDADLVVQRTDTDPVASIATVIARRPHRR